MPKYLWIFAVGLISIGLSGCGGEEKKEEKKDAGAPVAAGGAAPGGGGPGMPGMGGAGMPGMGGMPGMPGAGGGAAPAEKPAAAESAGSGSALGLMQFMPEDIQVAAGANIAAISEKGAPFHDQMMNQFQPVLSMLEGIGVTSGQIDQLWSGTNRDKGDVVVCVRTKADYNASNITKALGANGTAEKVGKANLRRITKNADFPNAVAYIDSKTFLIGRYDTVVASLKNPKPGSIRAGIDALAQPKAMFWISGANDDAAKKLHIKGFEGLDWFIKNAPKPRGMAISITNEYKGAKPAGGGQGPGGGMPGMPGGGMPGMPGAGGPGMPGAGGPGMPGGAGPGMPGGGMPGMGMPGMGMPGMGGGGGRGGATETKPIEVRVAWGFTSDAAAGLMKEIMESMIESLNQSGQSQGGAEAGGAGPGGAGPGGQRGPGGRGGRGRRGARISIPLDNGMQQQRGPGMGPGAGGPGMPGGGPGMAGGAPGMPGGAPGMPGGAPGMPGGGAGMPGMPGMGGAVDDSKVTYYRIEQTGENLKLIYHIPKDDAPTASKLIGRVMTASGLPALDDGLYTGTMTTLNKGISGWQAAKPDPLLGMRRQGPGIRIMAGYSWMCELLPYVGFDSAYKKFDFSQTWAMPYNAPYASIVVPAFLNPADPRVTCDGLGESIAATHFAGMAGVENGRNEVAAELPRTDPRAGIFGYDKVARLNEISDGQSQTIMMIGTGEVVAGWVQGGGATIRGARQPYFDKYSGFGSRGLKSGAYVLFADGTARVIPASIDPEIFKAMCTIHGSEQVDLGKLVGQSGGTQGGN